MPTPAPPAPLPSDPWEGGRIAFTSTRDGAAHIYVYDVGADSRGPARRLARGSHPAWSSDGLWIAFTGPSGGIHVMNANGAGERTIVSTGCCPSWSPDDRQLAYTTSNPSGGGPAGDLFAGDSDGTNNRKVVLSTAVDGNSIEAPDWSPDGLRIVFWGFGHWENPDRAHVVDTATWTIRNLPAFSRSPSWSPDGTLLAGHSHGANVVVTNASGDYASSHGLMLEGRALFPNRLDWSPTGRQLIFDASGGGRDSRIFVLTRATGSVQQAVSDDAAITSRYGDYAPSWSPR